MKKLLILFLLFITLTIQATTYYVSTSGNDGNAGTSGSPWRHIYYACAHTTSGDVINIGAGTFSESTQSVLYPGVSIVGQGATSIITGYIGSITSGQIDASSSAGTSTNGNQTISYILLDGNSYTGNCGISSWYRNNVTITNVTIQNYKERGISIQNGSDFMGSPSYSNSTNNSIHDCIFTNCGVGTGSWEGGDPDNEKCCIWFYGQTGLQLYNNTYNQSSQTYNVDILKGAWHTGTQIYNSTFNKPNGGNGGEWNFFTEIFFNTGGMNIYNNTFNGNASLDCVNNVPGTSGYGVKIYSNYFYLPAQAAKSADNVLAIDFEDWGANQQVYIYNNHFKNTNTAIQLDAVGQSKPGNIGGKVLYQQFYIYYNIFENIGNTTDTYSPAIDIKPEGTDSYIVIDQIYIDNNTLT